MELTRNPREEIKINKFNLLKEWEEQAERGMYWGEQSAIANRELNDIILERKMMKARLGRKFRQELEDQGRQTKDKVVEELIRTDPEYEKLTNKLIMAKEQAEIMDSVKWSFMTRKTALENIQQGIVNGLFADPRDINKKTDDSLRDAMEKRRRGE